MAVRTSIDVQVTGRQTGTALASIQHQGTRYIVAEAGEEFQVKVQLSSNGHRDHRVSSECFHGLGTQTVVWGTTQSAQLTAKQACVCQLMCVEDVYTESPPVSE